ncbi:MAG: OmpA family protein [Nitrospira sp.]|nr:OmpA family protein [Nitrospira sp.]
MEPFAHWGSALLGIAPFVGCTNGIDQRLTQVQRELEKSLHTNIAQGDLSIQRAGDHLTIVITERLLFAVGSHEIKPEGIDVLRRMGTFLKTASLKEIRVAGHGDRATGFDRPGAYSEMVALSKARATQAGRALNENGVHSQNAIIEWYGDIRPIASNETEEGRQTNRRVEILLYAAPA